jgi:hypothetical protein
LALIVLAAFTLLDTDDFNPVKSIVLDGLNSPFVVKFFELNDPRRPIDFGVSEV